MFARTAPSLRQSAFDETFAVLADLGIRHATHTSSFFDPVLPPSRQQTTIIKKISGIAKFLHVICNLVRIMACTSEQMHGWQHHGGTCAYGFREEIDGI
jgi:hypothetical protein